MKNRLVSKIQETLSSLDFPNAKIIIQIPRIPEHGDFASNIALMLTKELKQNPMIIAKSIVEKLLLLDKENIFDSIDIAKPGFINFKLNQDIYTKKLVDIVKNPITYGKSEIGKDKRALVEFVSANPTGPLTVGHGRGAMLGDTASNILEWNGYDVQREYYFNNAGRQMRVLGQSVFARYTEICGKAINFPEDGYQGEYIKEIAQLVFDENSDTLLNSEDSIVFKNKAESFIFEEIKNAMKQLGLVFDTFFNENELYDSGAIDKVISDLKTMNLVYENNGATWMKLTAMGRDTDKVMIKSTGEPTYRLPDIAYHRDKFERGYDLIVDVFGADHTDTYPDVSAAIKTLGYPEEKLKTLIHQFVTILKDEKQIKMSTRKANYITLEELVDDVGADVVRFFFIMRGMNSHLNFDLSVAKNQSDENPVFYLQYAHARVCNIIKRADAYGHQIDISSDCSMLSTDIEEKLLKKLLEFPEVIQHAHQTLEPQEIANYLMATAGIFHKFYAHAKVITDDKLLTSARLVLVEAVRIVLLNGLTVLGISAPERM
jgi:arginyl-tRNA synthetase